MKNLIFKELRLCSMAITYFFILFGLMAFLPGYPIALGSFFVCMGIFYSFQFSRESNDILFTLLLPVAKTDAVKGKFVFVLFIQGIAFLLTAVCTFVRMTVFAQATVYLQNPLANANLTFLGFTLVMYGLFNLIFLRGFFKTAYKIGAPFVCYCAAAMILVGIEETLVHIPGLEFFKATDFSNLGMQLAVLFAGAVFFLISTALSYRRSCKSFEIIDF